MKRIFLQIVFLIFSFGLKAQITIYFPNYNDAAQRPEKQFSYLEKFLVEIEGAEIKSVFSNNGFISKDTSNHKNYFCQPLELGNCIITVVDNTNKKYAKSIEIIDYPKLDFILNSGAFENSNILHYQIIDKSTRKEVTTDYNSGLFKVEIIDSLNIKHGYIFSQLNGVLDFAKSKYIITKGDKISIELYIFGKKSDLFAERFLKEFIIN